MASVQKNTMSFIACAGSGKHILILQVLYLISYSLFGKFATLVFVEILTTLSIHITIISRILPRDRNYSSTSIKK